MIGRLIDGRYRIQSLLASGGMGRVYKAEQLGLGRTVAIKVLAVDPSRQIQDPQFRERFALEAATASRLTSPYTITIFHYGRTDDDIYYIVMEYVEGTTLSQVLRQGGRLPVDRAVSIVGQVCLSLREAHARGIVHRDIKPSNIMLINGDYDQVKVLDFGIAKQMARESDPREDELTSSSSYIGTPEYMAPEYLEGRIDSRSDIYSVGVVLYLSVTGRLPFKGKTATQTILMSVQDRVPPIDASLGIPVALEEIIYACLEKDPELRPHSVDEVLRALQLSLVDPDGAPFGDSMPAIEIDMGMEPPADERLAAGSVDGPAPAPARKRPGRLARILLAGVALFSVGASAGLVARFTMDRTDEETQPEPAAKPVAPAPANRPAAPAAAVPPPSVKPFVAAPEPAPDSAGAPAATAPVERVEETEGARRPRRGVRARAEKSSRGPAPKSERAAPDRAAKEEPVPSGYKDSPY